MNPLFDFYHIHAGGAGHEPMGAGYVGKNFLSGAVIGQFFASPSSGQMIKLVELIATKETPVLFLFLNYTGDRLTFGAAKEYLTLMGYKHVQVYAFGDDVAPYIKRKRSSLVHEHQDVGNGREDDHNDGGGEEDDALLQIRRRGLCGVWLMQKIACILSEQGHTLAEIVHRLDEYSRSILTMTVALGPCHIPGRGPSFTIEPGMMELGQGVHGEPGIQRIQLLSAKNTVNLMVNELVQIGGQRGVLQSHHNRVALIVNNLGGLSQLEMGVLVKEAVAQCQAKSLQVDRIVWGTMMTSFDMKGLSLTMMAVDDTVLTLLNDGHVPGAELIEGLGRRTPPQGVNSEYLFPVVGQDASCPSLTTLHELEGNQADMGLLKHLVDQNKFAQALLVACNKIVSMDRIGGVMCVGISSKIPCSKSDIFAIF